MKAQAALARARARAVFGSRRSQKIRRFALRVYILLMAVVISYQTASAWILTPAHVDGASMLPTLQDSDLTFIWRLGYAGRLRTDGGVDYFFSAPKRGDVVAALVYLNSGEKALVSKRIIGLAGDNIEVRNGQVLVNMTAIDPPLGRAALKPFGPQVVAASHVFLMGDNTAVSYDSRLFGAVPESTLLGPLLPSPGSGPWIIDALRSLGPLAEQFTNPIRAITIPLRGLTVPLKSLELPESER